MEEIRSKDQKQVKREVMKGKMDPKVGPIQILNIIEKIGTLPKL